MKQYQMTEEEKYAMSEIENFMTRDDGAKAELCRIVDGYAYLYDADGKCIGKVAWGRDENK